MTYVSIFLGLCFIVGVVSVASNPAPYYGVVGLVWSALVGCCVLVLSGVSFLSLVLFMIYLGGMLVVFAYSVALASEPYPETWGNFGVMVHFLGGMGLVFVLAWWYLEGFNFDGLGAVEVLGLSMVRVDLGGSVMLYSWGGWCLWLCGVSLLLALFVVLEVASGGRRGGLREI
uniref:NADH-ubiquinone oxidoreductase chain 6 n=1 Tax=Smaug warreni TaxID=885424 RepID=Q6I7W3_9SAUR|nr:NADH dehydrogenase subunit 6 [Smaug warreni]BAD24761.1 NADH dehydrogenase subunit 6 [Smaug warreni]